MTLKRKYERLRKIEQSHNADEVLLAEIQDYKVCQLLCSKHAFIYHYILH